MIARCENKKNHHVSSSSPLLECHSSIPNLKELLEKLDNRIRCLSYPLDFLEKLITIMNENAMSTTNKIFYWPKITPFFTVLPLTESIVIMDKNNQDEKVFTMDLVNINGGGGENDYVFYPSLVRILYDRQLRNSSPPQSAVCELFTMKIGSSSFVIQPGSEFIASV
jgi:hypothetical protein